MNTQDDASAAASATYWDNLANEQIRAANWAEYRGLGDVSAYHNRAALYRRVAQSLRLEAETGLPHCSECLGPHPSHLCPKWLKK